MLCVYCMICENISHAQESHNSFPYHLWGAQDSSVSIVTGYKLDGSGIESRGGGEIFCPCPDRSWGPPSLLYNGYRVFPSGKADGAWC
jgi:hypothetical protein